MTKIVINRCYGGFGLSKKAYEWLIQHGIPIHKYSDENDGQVIFDRELTPKGEDDLNDFYYKHNGQFARYWDVWTRENRTHDLVVGVVEALGSEANGPHADLKVVEVPDDVKWHIDEYDGIEHVAEDHRTWGGSENVNS